MSYSSSLRLAIEKPCFCCLVGVTYAVINAMFKLGIYTREGAQKNRLIFIEVARMGDTFSSRSVFDRFYWQLPDNVKQIPILEHATMIFIMKMLDAQYMACKRGKHKTSETFITLDSLGLHKEAKKQ